MPRISLPSKGAVPIAQGHSAPFFVWNKNEGMLEWCEGAELVQAAE